MGAYDRAADWINEPNWNAFNAASGGQGEAQSQQYLNAFINAYKNQTGADPGLAEINNFFQTAGNQAAGLPGDLGYGDLNALTNNYVGNTFQQQAQDYQKQKEMDSLKGVQGTISDLVNQQTSNFTKQLSDPNSSTYQQFAGNMNNFGITPSSGAFQAGLGSTIGNAGSQFINAMLGGVTQPALQNIQGISQQRPNTDLTHLNDLGDFGLQASLARQMSGGGGSSLMGNIFGGANAASGLARGWGALKGPTWICTAMKKHGVITQDEISALHSHVFKAFWNRPFKFLGYFIFGQLLVWLAESVGTDWKAWKPCFYQDIMAESDSVKAVALYEESFWSLFRVVRQRIAGRGVLA